MFGLQRANAGDFYPKTRDLAINLRRLQVHNKWPLFTPKYVQITWKMQENLKYFFFFQQKSKDYELTT